MAPSPGGWPPPAAALRSQLKASAGRLTCQLYARNGRRPFAPVEVFEAEALPADRFQAEMGRGISRGSGSAGGADGGGGAGGGVAEVLQDLGLFGALSSGGGGAPGGLPAATAPGQQGQLPGGPAGEPAGAVGSTRAWGLLAYAFPLVPFRERAK